MNTVIIINLNGNAFHLEEPGFASLRAYLERAQAQLKDNPDKAEIMADLEQAIADKCAHFLQPHKNVITAAEIEEVLKEMGPVQSENAADPAAAASTSSNEESRSGSSAAGSAPKRLYQIREGAMLSGVCTGLAAYLNVDVTIVRIAFVLLTLVTTGAWILVYLGMMLVVPFANTGEEYAAAAGAPFNAQEVIDRAKKHYAEFKDSKEWRRHWRQQRREWRRRWHEGAYWWGHNLQRNVHQFSSVGYGGYLGATLLIPFLAVFNAALFCLCIAAIVSLATTGAIFGWVIGSSIPLWVSILILLLFYGMISRPLRHARRAIYFNTGGHSYYWFAAWYEILSTGVLVLVCWYGYTHVPEVHDFFQHFLQNVTTMWNNVVESFRHTASHKPGTGIDARLPAAAAAASTSAFFALRT